MCDACSCIVCMLVCIHVCIFSPNFFFSVDVDPDKPHACLKDGDNLRCSPGYGAPEIVSFSFELFLRTATICDLVPGPQK